MLGQRMFEHFSSGNLDTKRALISTGLRKAVVRVHDGKYLQLA